MKVQVNLKIASKFEASAAMFNFTVNLMDTVLSLKERLAAAHMVAFPERDILLDGKVLSDELKLSDCGVKENSSLDFVVHASEASLVKQFADLLQARDLSSDEIGMMYCYKYGVSANQSLKVIGYDGKLVDFLKTQKSLLVEGGRVTLVRQDTKMKPFSVIDELKLMLGESGTGSMEISELSRKFSKKFKLSIKDISGMKAAELLATEKDVFDVTARGSVTLKEADHDDAEDKLVQAIVASHRNSVPGQLQKEEKAVARSPPGLASDESTDAGSVVEGEVLAPKVEEVLKDIVDTVSQAMFLNVHHVNQGWCYGSDSANPKLADAEVVFYLQGLPASAESKWLPALLKSAAAVLTESLCPTPAGKRQYPSLLKSNAGCWIQGIRVTEDSLQMQVKDVVDLNLRFASTFNS